MHHLVRAAARADFAAAVEPAQHLDLGLVGRRVLIGRDLGAVVLVGRVLSLLGFLCLVRPAPVLWVHDFVKSRVRGLKFHEIS